VVRFQQSWICSSPRFYRNTSAATPSQARHAVASTRPCPETSFRRTFWPGVVETGSLTGRTCHFFSAATAHIFCLGFLGPARPIGLSLLLSTSTFTAFTHPGNYDSLTLRLGRSRAHDPGASQRAAGVRLPHCVGRRLAAAVPDARVIQNRRAANFPAADFSLAPNVADNGPLNAIDAFLGAPKHRHGKAISSRRAETALHRNGVIHRSWLHLDSDLRWIQP